MRGSRWRRMRWTAAGLAADIMSRLAVVWRRSWKRIWRTSAFGQRRYEFAGHRDRFGALALGGFAPVGAGDRDQAGAEVNVALAQAEQLALTHAGVDRGREQRSTAAREVVEDSRHLFDPPLPIAF